MTQEASIHSPVERADLPSSHAQPAIPRYAVLFRTHLWDAFVERQYRRLVAQVGQGDVFIVANNTSGTCNAIAGLPFVTFTERDIEALGYARAGAGELLWYNVDYALYYFVKHHADYDYYVIFEYDVVSNVPLDDLLAKAHARGVDLIGLTKGDPVSQWWFRSTCLEAYDEATIRKMLLPLAVYSKRAVAHLSRRRLDLADALRSGRITQWPHCEAFIVTELALGGFKIDELCDYGSTAKLSYEPAYLEQDLGNLGSDSFIHPVLDPIRYAANIIKYEWRPEKYFLPSSEFRRRLAPFPVRAYAKPLGRAIRGRIMKLPDILARKLRARGITRPVP